MFCVNAHTYIISLGCIKCIFKLVILGAQLYIKVIYTFHHIQDITHAWESLRVQFITKIHAYETWPGAYN